MIHRELGAIGSAAPVAVGPQAFGSRHKGRPRSPGCAQPRRPAEMAGHDPGIYVPGRQRTTRPVIDAAIKTRSSSSISQPPPRVEAPALTAGHPYEGIRPSEVCWSSIQAARPTSREQDGGRLRQILRPQGSLRHRNGERHGPCHHAGICPRRRQRSMLPRDAFDTVQSAISDCCRYEGITAASGLSKQRPDPVRVPPRSVRQRRRYSDAPAVRSYTRNRGNTASSALVSGRT